MPKSVSENVRDALTEHDLKVRRVTGGFQRDVDSRLKKLGQDLKVLVVVVDVHGAKRRDSRERRMKRLTEESRKLIREAYSQISTEMRKNTRRLAVVESRKIGRVLREEIP